MPETFSEIAMKWHREMIESMNRIFIESYIANADTPKTLDEIVDEQIRKINARNK